jgi:hypothetical protein
MLSAGSPDLQWKKKTSPDLENIAMAAEKKGKHTEEMAGFVLKGFETLCQIACISADKHIHANANAYNLSAFRGDTCVGF